MSLDTAYRILAIGNLLLSLLGLAWILGSDARRRDIAAWRGWLVFWLGTAAYYVVQAVLHRLHVHLQVWIEQLGLYAATVALLNGYAFSSGPIHEGNRSLLRALTSGGVVIASIVVVAGAAVLDVVWVDCRNKPALWHQMLICFAILPWAWRLRAVQPTRSILMAVYALAQLPFQQVLERAITPAQQDIFNLAAFFVYFAGKVPLISSVHFAIQKPAPLPGLRDPARPVTVTRGAFISYAFEDVEDARWLRQTLERSGVNAFVASEDLLPRVGSAEWSAVIDDVLDATEVLILLSTPHALGSRWVTYEWRSVHNEILSGKEKSIVVLSLRGPRADELPRALKRYLCLDWRDPGERAANIPRLVAMLIERLSVPESLGLRNSTKA